MGVDYPWNICRVHEDIAQDIYITLEVQAVHTSAASGETALISVNGLAVEALGIDHTPGAIQ